MSLRKQIIQKNWPQSEPDIDKLLHLMRLEILEHLKKVIRGEVTSYVGFAPMIEELEAVEREHMAAVCDAKPEMANEPEEKKRGRKPKVNPEDF